MVHFLKSLKTKLKALSKKKFPYLSFIFVTVLACDQLIKYIFHTYLQNLQSPSFLGFSLEPFFNYHWAFGFELGMNPVLSFIAFSGLFCIVIYSYILLIYYSSFSKLFNASLTVLFVGIISNLIDRIQRGYILDFMAFKWEPYINIHFNASDILQTFAWALLIYTIILNRRKIWIPNEYRKKLLIMKAPQVEFIIYLSLTALFIATFFVLLNYQFLNYFQEIETKGEEHLLIRYFINYSLVVLVALIIPIIGISIYLSNKIYGPIYAFDKYIKELLNGENPKDLKLRDNDQLKKEFESLSLKIKNKINKS